MFIYIQNKQYEKHYLYFKNRFKKKTTIDELKRLLGKIKF